MAVEMIDLVYVGKEQRILNMIIKPGMLGCLPKSVYSNIDIPDWVPVNSISNEEESNEQT